jgi:hypothetical protein
MTKPYTQSEVFRTAHQYVEPGVFASLGDGKTDGINEVCRCCKSEATAIQSKEHMQPFKDFYKTLDYKAYQCKTCG